MKKLSRVLALVMALMLALPSLALASAEPMAQAADPVLFTFDGEEVTLSQVDHAMNNMINNGYLADATDYETVLQYMVQDRVFEAKIAELGFDQFTPEEEEALRADAQHEWEEALNDYVAYFLSEDTPEARAALYDQAVEYYTSRGVDLDLVYDSLKHNVPYERLEDYALEGKDVTVTEEEIRSTFEQYAEEDRTVFLDNAPMYEYYLYYQNYKSWYRPEGYRGIIHILLKVDDELLSAYQDAQAAYEEAQGEETPDQAKIDEAKAALDAAWDAVMASKQDVIDQINARLEQGESFAALIAEYGEDPGMKQEENLTAGYQVHQDSIVWDPAFTAAAFSEKMQQPGDVSDPTIGQNGIHILCYLRDVPGGYVEIDEAIHDEIEAYLTNPKISAALNEAEAAWTSEHTIVRNEEAIADAIAAAQAAAQAAAPDAAPDAEQAQ